MESKYLSAKMPDLDGPTAFLLIGLLDRLVAELWILYGDEILRDAAAGRPATDSESAEPDLPF